MESDFTTRNHLDSVIHFSDPGIGDLLHKYRNPPVESKHVLPPSTSSSPGGESAPSNVYISNMLGQLQGVIQSMAGGNKEPQSLAGSGLQLSVNADILRWMLVLAFAVVLVVVMFQFMNRRRSKNPLKMKKRLRRLEDEIKALRMKNPAPTLKQDDYESEDEFVEEQDD